MRKALTITDITTGKILHTHHVLNFDDPARLEVRAEQMRRQMARVNQLPDEQVVIDLTERASKPTSPISVA
jgi:hypothetical protein